MPCLWNRMFILVPRSDVHILLAIQFNFLNTLHIQYRAQPQHLKGYKDSDWGWKENYDRRKMTRSLHVWQRYLKCLLLYGSTRLVVIWHRLHLALVTIRSLHQSRSDNLTRPLSSTYIKLSIKAKCFQTDLPAPSLNLTPRFAYT